MSTETPKAKEKKEKKDKSEKSEKKRKRGQFEEVAATEESVSKKKKKKKDRKASDEHSVETNGANKLEEMSEKETESQQKPARSKPISQPEQEKISQALPKEKKSKKTPARGNDTATSPFVQLTESFYVTLSPCANNFPLEGACAEHISPLLLTYYAPFNGVMLSYANPRLSEYPQGFKEKSASQSVLAKSVDEYGVTFIWLTADFVVFRPSKGTAIDGYVSLQNESILGLVCYNYFNAAIDRQHLPEDWKWTGDNRGEEGEAEGYYVDGDGNKVEGKVSFRVTDFKADLGTNTISIGGTLLPEGTTLARADASGSKKKKKNKKKEKKT